MMTATDDPRCPLRENEFSLLYRRGPPPDKRFLGSIKISETVSFCDIS